MYGFCNVWVCIYIYIYIYIYIWVLKRVGLCIYGFCNVWVCVYMGFVTCVCVCVGSVMCGCVYTFYLLTLFHSMFHYKRQYYMLEIAYI